MSSEQSGSREGIIQRALTMYNQGLHCSEAVLYAGGMLKVPDFDPGILRMATGFGGGIAEAADVCGALVGGVMVIGLLYGRVNLDEDQTRCWELARRYRQRFLEELGSTECFYFTGGKFNLETHRKCALVVETGIRILLAVLDDEAA